MGKKPLTKTIANCPKCNKPIYENHPYTWCKECGEHLPKEMQDLLPANNPRQPVAFIGIDARELEAIERLAPEAVNGRRIFGGLAQRDESHLIIGILPLYFNIHRQYIFFTDMGIIFCNRTLWQGFKGARRLGYESIRSLTLTPQRFFSLKASSWSLTIGCGGPADTPLKINCQKQFFALVEENFETIRKLAPHVQVSVQS